MPLHHWWEVSIGLDEWLSLIDGINPMWTWILRLKTVLTSSYHHDEIPYSEQYHASIMIYKGTTDTDRSLAPALIQISGRLLRNPQSDFANANYPAVLFMESLPVCDIRPKRILNSNLAKSRLPITYFAFVQSLWNFAQSTAVSLPCSVHNFETMGLPKSILWRNEISRDSSLI